MTDLNEKALEAAFKAAAPGLRNNRWDEGIEAAIQSYLSHISKDEATLERVADAISREVDLREGKYRSPIDEARAALSALLSTEQKP